MQSRVSRLQQQLTEAGSSLAAAEAAWAAERAELEAAKASAIMTATAAEVQRQVEAAVTGALLGCEMLPDTLALSC